MIDVPGDSPAGMVMNEAIELAIAEESPFPEASAFIDADTPSTESQIAKALSEGFAAVVVSKDGSTQVIRPESASAD
jgi:hypothetical protein